MPHVTHPTSVPSGPLVDLFVGVSKPRSDALVAAGQTPPPLQKLRAMIDTGASCTVIDPDALKPLNLMATGSTPIHTPSTQGVAAKMLTYDVLVALYHVNHSLIIGTFPIVETHLSSQGIDALIGRDILQHCLLIYDGAAGRVTLSF